MQIEIRNDHVLIRGYVNAVERDSRKIPSPKGEFVEQVRSGTWKKAIEKSEDIAALLNHDWSKKIGSTKDNLELREDNIGLYAELRANDPDIKKKASENRLVGWSFRFVKNQESWGKTDDGTERRYLDDIDLLEVSVLDDTKTPAYYGTSVEVRDNEEVFVEYRNYEGDIEIINNQEVVPEEELEGTNEDELKEQNELEQKLKLIKLELELG